MRGKLPEVWIKEPEWCNLCKIIIVFARAKQCSNKTNFFTFIFHVHDTFLITKSSIWKSPDVFRSHTLRTWENTEEIRTQVQFYFRFYCWQPLHTVYDTQYGISQLTSHQCSRTLADCFRLSWRHQNMWAIWSQEQPHMKLWASFPKIYRFQQANLIRKLTLWISLACWNRKI